MCIKSETHLHKKQVSVFDKLLGKSKQKHTLMHTENYYKLSTLIKFHHERV